MLVRYFTGTESDDNESGANFSISFRLSLSFEVKKSRTVEVSLPLICPDRGYYLLDPTKEFERTQTALGALFK